MADQGKRRAINVQLHIHAPTGTPGDIIRRAIIHKCDTGEDTPAIDIQIIDWTGRKETGAIDQGRAWRSLGRTIKAAHIRADREG